jgi:hypothetical protein
MPDNEACYSGSIFPQGIMDSGKMADSQWYLCFGGYCLLGVRSSTSLMFMFFTFETYRPIARTVLGIRNAADTCHQTKRYLTSVTR